MPRTKQTAVKSGKQGQVRISPTALKQGTPILVRRGSFWHFATIVSTTRRYVEVRFKNFDEGRYLRRSFNSRKLEISEKCPCRELIVGPYGAKQAKFISSMTRPKSNSSKWVIANSRQENPPGWYVGRLTGKKRSKPIPAVQVELNNGKLRLIDRHANISFIKHEAPYLLSGSLGVSERQEILTRKSPLRKPRSPRAIKALPPPKYVAPAINQLVIAVAPGILGDNWHIGRIKDVRLVGITVIQLQYGEFGHPKVIETFVPISEKYKGGSGPFTPTRAKLIIQKHGLRRQ